MLTLSTPHLINPPYQSTVYYQDTSICEERNKIMVESQITQPYLSQVDQLMEEVNGRVQQGKDLFWSEIQRL